VAARSDDAGQRKRPAFGDIEVCRNKKAGPALEDNFFYLVGVTLNDAGNTRFERRFFRPWPETLLNLFANVTNVCFGVGLCFKTGTPLIRS
jgi:hypothetical protein